MHPDLRTHTLVRIPDARCLLADSPPGTQPPQWVKQALTQAPWVVIRRAPPTDTTLPVGVRGTQRHERYATWLPAEAILEHITPQTLAEQRAWISAPRRKSIAALAALEEVAGIMRDHGLAGLWGPGGSVGFELATGYPAAHTESDLDLSVQLPTPPSLELAASLYKQLATLPARCDMLLETPAGAIALAEYAQGIGAFILRTPQGPCLYRTPAGTERTPNAADPLQPLL